jgi:hypothetical protein
MKFAKEIERKDKTKNQKKEKEKKQENIKRPRGPI